MVVRASEIAQRDLPALLQRLQQEAGDQSSLYLVVCIDEPVSVSSRPANLASIVDEVRSHNGVTSHRGPCLRVADLRMDRDRFEVQRAGRPIHLSLTEFRLLETLMRNHDRVLDVSFLARSLCHNSPPNAASNSLWVYIHRLRRKVDHPPCVPLIRTIRGQGYVLQSPVLDAAS